MHENDADQIDSEYKEAFHTREAPHAADGTSNSRTFSKIFEAQSTHQRPLKQYLVVGQRSISEGPI